MTARALVGVRLWDGMADAPAAEPQTIRVERGRIVAIGSGASLRRDCQVIELSGATALPGLIDSHVHLVLDPEIGDPADQEKVAPEVRDSAMQARALAMLRAGITTARDLGGPDGREFALRDRIAHGELPGPRLLCAGQPVTTPKGHCWFWGGEAANEDEIREVVTRQLDRGCDWVKVMATGGIITKGTSPRDAQFSTAELRALVAAAGARGRPVAAHAHGTAGIRNAAEARVATIEHCSFVGEQGGFGSEAAAEVIDLLVAGGVRVSPTINAGWQRFEAKDGKPSEMFGRVRAGLTAMREAGIPLIASTDAGIPRVAHDQLPRALPVFARYADFSPTEALRSATSVAAQGLGLGDVTGRLAVGWAADVLVVDGDPTQDLSALQTPLAVLARGRLARAPGPEVDTADPE